jgi:CPA2 family monovalent cation:H+ antiporter-2
MHQISPLIAVIAAALGLAFILGTIANRLKLPPLVGYLLAGVVVGPFTPGFVADTHLTLQLAEIGVILLMFGVGLKISPRDLLAVKGVAGIGAPLQMAAITALGLGAVLAMGWPVGEGIFFGVCLSVASSVVVMRSLQDRRQADTPRGRVAVGWLVVQDLMTVLVLVVLPPMAGLLRGETVQPDVLVGALAVTMGKLGLFAALMLLVGRRVIPEILHYTAHTGSRELFRLAVLSVALGVAFMAAYAFGVSIALGAFFAGMLLSGSPLSQRAAEESLPLRDAFAVLFFVSVGMLFNPGVLLRAPGALAITFAIVMAGSAIAYLLLRARKVGPASAAMVAVSLAQIGEFSFILADLGIELGVLRTEARDLILGVSILSILINPLLFALVARREDIAHEPDRPRPAPDPTTLKDHAVVVGYGRVGKLIADGLAGQVPLLVIEEGAVGLPGVEHIRGNAAKDEVLAASNLKEARMLFVAIPQAFEAGQIVQQARRANASLPIIARAHFDAEVDHLRKLGANQVVMGEREIALAMLDFARAR